MRLADHIIRIPRPFDLERGQTAAAAVPTVDGAVKELIVGTAGCSPYLAGLIEKEADWLPAALEDVNAALGQALINTGQDLTSLKPALRQAKRRVALLAALADLAGAWDLEDVTGALTRLADMGLRGRFVGGPERTSASRTFTRQRHGAVCVGHGKDGRV